MADDERLRRIGLNEVLYREVNEKVEAVNEAFGDMRPDFAIVCECGELTCTEQILVPRAVYEETRADSTRFLVLPGHQIEDVEQVVEDHGTFVVLEKTPAEAQALAEETDPRQQ